MGRSRDAGPEGKYVKYRRNSGVEDMLFDEFVKKSHANWSHYLKFLSDGITGKVRDFTFNTKGYVLFPTMILLYEYDSHFVMELTGGSTTYIGLQRKVTRKCGPIEGYYRCFDDGAEEPTLVVSSPLYVSNCTLLQDPDMDGLSRRFPVILDHRESVWQRRGGRGPIFKPVPGHKWIALFNCFLGATRNNHSRCHYFLGSIAVERNVKSFQLQELYEHCHGLKAAGGMKEPKDAVGIYTTPNSEGSKYLISAQLMSMVLSEAVRETTIGSFLDNHKYLFNIAFSCTETLSEINLPWLEHDGSLSQDDEQYIRPDLFLKREDGYYDICDLKLALIDQIKITKGKRSRRDYISYIRDGISQLANYREYFTYKNNAHYAQEKFGIKVQNPRLILIVGNSENYIKEEIAQASRSLDNFDILDYDTLASLAIKDCVK